MASFREVFNKTFSVIFAGYALQLTADAIKNLALAVLVYEQTNSPALSATAYMIGFLPYLVGSTFFTSIGDRISPRTLITAIEFLRVAVALVLAYAGLPVWAMLAVVLLTGTLSPISLASRQGLMPEILQGDAFVLGRSVMSTTAGISQVLSLAIGGAILIATGPITLLVISAGLSGASGLVVLLMLPSFPPRRERTAGAIRDTLSMNRQLLTTPGIRGSIFAQWFPIGLITGAEAALVPYLGESAGLGLAAASGGMAIGTFVVGRLMTESTRARTTLPLALFAGVPLLAFAIQPDFWLAAVLAGASGVGSAYYIGLQRRFADLLPEQGRGQAFGLLSGGMMTGQGVGAALVGGLAEVVPTHFAITITGAACIVACLLLTRHLSAKTLAMAA